VGNVTPPALSAPAPLSSGHDLSRFDCGKPVLNDWLRNFAQRSEGKSARCFVVCAGNVVVGYHCIATGAVDRDSEAPKAMRRGMPATLPIMLIGRLAVDKQYQGQGIGKALLKDALQRILNATKDVGARAVVVHAIDDEAALFYKQYGFKAFPTDSRTLFLSIAEIAAALG
jgi:GNAT superfamily N-acetyltransferase